MSWLLTMPVETFLQLLQNLLSHSFLNRSLVTNLSQVQSFIHNLVLYIYIFIYAVPML